MIGKLKMKIFFISGLISICAMGNAQTKTEKIKTLLETTNSAQMGIQVATQFIESFKTAYPTVPQKFWDDYLKEIKPEEIQNMIIPIYAKHLTEKEIEDITAFYKTPSGKSFLEKMPVIFMESQSVGQEWGQKLAEKVYQQIESSSQYQSPPPPMETKRN